MEWMQKMMEMPLSLLACSLPCPDPKKAVEANEPRSGGHRTLSVDHDGLVFTLLDSSNKLFLSVWVSSTDDLAIIPVLHIFIKKFQF